MHESTFNRTGKTELFFKQVTRTENSFVRDCDFMLILQRALSKQRDDDLEEYVVKLQETSFDPTTRTKQIKDTPEYGN